MCQRPLHGPHESRNIWGRDWLSFDHNYTQDSQVVSRVCATHPKARRGVKTQAEGVCLLIFNKAAHRHTWRVQFCISGKTDHPMTGKYIHPPSQGLHQGLSTKLASPQASSLFSPQVSLKEAYKLRHSIILPFSLFVWQKQTGMNNTLSMTRQTPVFWLDNSP